MSYTHLWFLVAMIWVARLSLDDAHFGLGWSYGAFYGSVIVYIVCFLMGI